MHSEFTRALTFQNFSQALVGADGRPLGVSNSVVYWETLMADPPRPGPKSSINASRLHRANWQVSHWYLPRICGHVKAASMPLVSTVRTGTEDTPLSTWYPPGISLISPAPWQAGHPLPLLWQGAGVCEGVGGGGAAVSWRRGRERREWGGWGGGWGGPIAVPGARGKSAEGTASEYGDNRLRSC